MRKAQRRMSGQDDSRRSHAAFNPGKLMAYSAAGVLLSGGLCGLREDTGRLQQIGTAVFLISASAWLFAFPWAVLEGVVEVFRNLRR